eukprot:gene91-3484_t
MSALNERVHAVLQRALGEAVFERLGSESIRCIQQDLADLVKEQAAEQLQAAKTNASSNGDHASHKVQAVSSLKSAPQANIKQAKPVNSVAASKSIPTSHKESVTAVANKKNLPQRKVHPRRVQAKEKKNDVDQQFPFTLQTHEAQNEITKPTKHVKTLDSTKVRLSQGETDDSASMNHTLTSSNDFAQAVLSLNDLGLDAIQLANKLASLRSKAQAEPDMVSASVTNDTAITPLVELIQTHKKTLGVQLQALSLFETIFAREDICNHVSSASSIFDILFEMQLEKSPIVSLRATNVISLLTRNPKVKQIMIERDALSNLVSAMESHKSNTNLQMACLGLLEMLAVNKQPLKRSKSKQQSSEGKFKNKKQKEDPEQNVLVTRSVQAILDVIEQQSVEQIQEKAYILLNRFASSCSPEQILPILLRPIEHYSANDRILTHVLSIFDNILQRPSPYALHDTFASSGIVQHLVKMIETDPGNLSTTERSLTSNGSISNGIKPEILAGVFSSLTQLAKIFGSCNLTRETFSPQTVCHILSHMKTHSGLPALHQHALALLASITFFRNNRLSLDARNAAAAIITGGGLTTIIDVMERHSTNDDIQMYACQLCLNLSGLYKPSHLEMLKAGFLQRGISALNKHSKNRVIVRAATSLIHRIVNGTGTLTPSKSSNSNSKQTNSARQKPNKESEESKSNDLNTEKNKSLSDFPPSSPAEAALLSINRTETTTALMLVLQFSIRTRDDILRSNAIDLLYILSKVKATARAISYHQGFSSVLATLRHMLKNKATVAIAGQFIITLAHRSRPRSFVEAKGLELLVMILTPDSGRKNNHGYPELVDVLSALAVLSADNVAATNLTYTSVILPQVLRIVDDCVDNAKIQTLGLSILRNLEALPTKDVLSRVLRAMQLHGGHAEVQAEACGIIRNIALHDTDIDLLVAQDVLTSVLASMRTNVASAPVVEQACGAMCNLAVNEGFRARISRAGGIETIIQAMGTHINQPSVQEHACRALWNLSANERNQELVGTEGGIDQIVEAMITHPNNELVQEAACGALGNLLLNSSNKVRAEAVGFAAAIAAAKSKFPGNEYIQ